MATALTALVTSGVGTATQVSDAERGQGSPQGTTATVKHLEFGGHTSPYSEAIFTACSDRY